MHILHLYKSQGGRLPVSAGIVSGGEGEEVFVRVQEWDKTLRFKWREVVERWCGTLEWGIASHYLYYLDEYQEEKEMMAVEERERERSALRLERFTRQKGWRALPIDVLDDICAILRENGEDV